MTTRCQSQAVECFGCRRRTCGDSAKLLEDESGPQCGRGRGIVGVRLMVVFDVRSELLGEFEELALLECLESLLEGSDQMLAIRSDEQLGICDAGRAPGSRGCAERMKQLKKELRT